MNHYKFRKVQYLFFVIIFLFPGLSFTSCLELDSDYKDRLSVISNISLPDSVEMGNPLIISFITHGSNLCWKKGHDEIIKIKNGFRVIPYDREYTGPNMCAQAIADFDHQVSLPASTEDKILIEILHRLRDSSGADSTGIISKEVIVY